MSFLASVSFSDVNSSMSYTHKRDLSDLEIICFDTRHIPEIPSLISDNIFKTLNLPLRQNSYDLLSINFVVTVRNTYSGRIFGTSLDPYITFPHSENSVLIENIPFHPLISEQNNTINFI